MPIIKGQHIPKNAIVKTEAAATASGVYLGHTVSFFIYWNIN